MTPTNECDQTWHVLTVSGTSSAKSKAKKGHLWQTYAVLFSGCNGIRTPLSEITFYETKIDWKPDILLIDPHFVLKKLILKH
jgi:hypothetical protein